MRLTTRPWAVNADGGTNVMHFWNGKLRIIAHCTMPDWHENLAKAREEAEANAAAIVHRVNTYEQVVDALRWIVNNACDVGKAGGQPESGECEASLRAGVDALEAAKVQD